jgi:hypothetical protein
MPGDENDVTVEGLGMGSIQGSKGGVTGAGGGTCFGMRGLMTNLSNAESVEELVLSLTRSCFLRVTIRRVWGEVRMRVELMERGNGHVA